MLLFLNWTNVRFDELTQPRVEVPSTLCAQPNTMFVLAQGLERKFVANPVPRFAQCPADYSRKKVRLKDAMVCPAAKEGSASSCELMEKQKMRLSIFIRAARQD